LGGSYQEPGMGPDCRGAERGVDRESCRRGRWECEWHCVVLGGEEVVMLAIGIGEVRLLKGLIILRR
jgi:hypothetical protein